MMKHIYTGLLVVLAAAFAVPAFAQDAAQVARAVSPLGFAQYQDQNGQDDNQQYDNSQYNNSDHNGGDSIDCGSARYERVRCPVQWRDARLVRQTSDSACVRGSTWGIDRDGIWVDQGCGGTFVEAGRRRDHRDHRDHRDRGDGGDWHPGPGWDSAIRLRCASEGYQYNMCQVDTGRGSAVRIERQISKTRCVKGRTWGFNRAGIWVDGGCEAIFRVDRRWR